ncbi:MAG: hypothetical protein E4H14_11985 [Candidatus Thorarchaeota archaeon]|nr:MAG: hypothetical protein E4H14_11985 [Candidatus Thorarchaeota archaeon]
MSDPLDPAHQKNTIISDIPLVGEPILYDVFKRGGELTNDKISKLERMFYSTLRQMDRCKNDASPYPGIETPLQLAVYIYSKLIEHYVELAVPILPPATHERFLIAPELFVSSGEINIPELVERKFNLLTLSINNSWNLSKVMIKFIRMSVAADLGKKKMH